MDIFYIIFPHKYSLFNTQYIGKVSTSHLFSIWRYQAKCVIKFLLRQLLISSKAMADRDIRGEDRNKKIWISKEQKELFRWAILWWKNKKKQTQVLKISLSRNYLCISSSWFSVYSFRFCHSLKYLLIYSFTYLLIYLVILFYSGKFAKRIEVLCITSPEAQKCFELLSSWRKRKERIR